MGTVSLQTESDVGRRGRLRRCRTIHQVETKRRRSGGEGKKVTARRRRRRRDTGRGSKPNPTIGEIFPRTHTVSEVNTWGDRLRAKGPTVLQQQPVVDLGLLNGCQNS